MDGVLGVAMTQVVLDETQAGDGRAESALRPDLRAPSARAGDLIRNDDRGEHELPPWLEKHRERRADLSRWSPYTRRSATTARDGLRLDPEQANRRAGSEGARVG